MYLFINGPSAYYKIQKMQLSSNVNSRFGYFFLNCLYEIRKYECKINFFLLDLHRVRSRKNSRMLILNPRDKPIYSKNSSNWNTFYKIRSNKLSKTYCSFFLFKNIFLMHITIKFTYKIKNINFTLQNKHSEIQGYKILYL